MNAISHLQAIQTIVWSKNEYYKRRTEVKEKYHKVFNFSIMLLILPARSPSAGVWVAI